MLTVKMSSPEFIFLLATLVESVLGPVMVNMSKSRRS